jgi:hypothetical protein
MQDPWSLATMVLVAVLVGACLPVLLQLFLTLGATRRLLQRVGPKLDGTLAELHETSRRLNRATTGFDESAQRARAFLDATGDLGRSVQQIHRSLRPAVLLGSALGPALLVAIKTLIERYGRPAERGRGDSGDSAQGGGDEDAGDPAATVHETSGHGGES